MLQYEEHFENIESLLKLMLRDIRDDGLSKSETSELRRSSALQFETMLEKFRSQAAIIRQLFDRFQRSDRSTRIYVQKHIEEEYAALEEAYRSLSKSFSETEQDH
jgi:hypothetical protein